MGKSREECPHRTQAVKRNISLADLADVGGFGRCRAFGLLGAEADPSPDFLDESREQLRKEAL